MSQLMAQPMVENLNEKGTRLKLLLAAEKLLAKRGFSNISQRQILQAADQKNASAMSYHFGSMDGMISAVIDLRMGAVNARRMTVLDEIDSGRRSRSYESLAYAALYPLAVELEPRPDGNYYLRFLSQLLASNMTEGHMRVTGDQSASIDRMVRLYRALRPDLSDDGAAFNFTLARNMTVLTLAQLEAMLEDSNDVGSNNFNLRLAQIAEAAASILKGPAHL